MEKRAGSKAIALLVLAALVAAGAGIAFGQEEDANSADGNWAAQEETDLNNTLLDENYAAVEEPGLNETRLDLIIPGTREESTEAKEPSLKTFIISPEQMENLDAIIESLLKGEIPEGVEKVSAAESMLRIEIENNCAQEGEQEIGPMVTRIDGLITCYEGHTGGFCEDWVCKQSDKIEQNGTIRIQYNLMEIIHHSGPYDWNYDAILTTQMPGGGGFVCIGHDEGSQSYYGYRCNVFTIAPMDELGRWSFDLLVHDFIDSTEARANIYADVVNCPNTCEGEVWKHDGYLDQSTKTCAYETQDCESLNTAGEWEYYCSGKERKKHRVTADYDCAPNGCFLGSEYYTDDQVVERCTFDCHQSQCVSGCSGTLTIKAEDFWGEGEEEAIVLVNGKVEGTTNANGELQVPTFSDSCGGVYSIEVKRGEYSCGTKRTIISHFNKNSVVMFSCDRAGGALVLDVQPSTTTPNLGDTVSFEITVTDESGNLIGNAEIGIYDPIKYQNASTTTDSSGNATYTTTAYRIRSTGFFNFHFVAGKKGYWAATEKVRIEVKTGYVTIQAVNEKGEPIGNAAIFIDGVEKARTQDNGKAEVTENGARLVAVIAPSGQSCGERSIEFTGTKRETFVCPGVTANDFDGDGWTDEEEELFGSSPTDPNDNFCTRLQQSYDKDLMSKITIGAVIDLIPNIGFLSTEETPDENISEYWTINGAYSAAVLGAPIGILAGIGGGAIDDWEALKSAPVIVGGLWNVATNQQMYVAMAEKHRQEVMQPILTKCQSAKTKMELINSTRESITEGYWNDFIPEIYRRADRVNIMKIYNKGDDDDKAIFNHCFVSGYHIGYAVEQVVLADVLVEKAFAAIKSNKVVVGAANRGSQVLLDAATVTKRLVDKFDAAVVTTLKKIRLKNGTMFDSFIVHWTDEMQDGLGYIGKNTDESFTIGLARRSTEPDLRVISEGVEHGLRTGAIDEAGTTVKGLTQYTEASWKQGLGSPFNPANAEDELVMLIENTTHGGTKVGTTTIDDVTGLVKGTDDWGWQHIWKKHVTGEIPGGSTFQQIYDAADETTIKQWINEAIENGTPIPDPQHAGRWIYEYYPQSLNPSPMHVVVSENGRIITAFPKVR